MPDASRLAELNERRNEGPAEDRFRVVVNEADGAAGEKTAEIYLYDIIGEDFWSGGGVTAKRFVEAVNAAGDVSAITLNINSPGGDVFEGETIYNYLVRHKATVTVNIDGLAASAASLICMAGDDIRIAANGLMMIHQAAGMEWGRADDLRKTAELLDIINATIADTYVARTKQTREQVDAWMADEKWFDSAEAVACGFATGVNESKKAAACAALSPQIVAKFKHAERAKALLAGGKDQPMPSQSEIDAAKKAEAEADAKVKAEAEAAAKAKAEADAKVEAEADAAAKAKAEADAAATAENRAEVKRFTDAFGFQNGATWFSEGKSFADAQAEHVKALEAKNKALQLRIDQAGKGAGEEKPLSVDPGKDGAGDGKKDRFANRLPKNLARFANGIKLPSRPAAGQN